MSCKGAGKATLQRNAMHQLIMDLHILLQEGKGSLDQKKKERQSSSWLGPPSFASSLR